jgi:tetratricopeptide (TPR) repeat protein
LRHAVTELIDKDTEPIAWAANQNEIVMTLMRMENLIEAEPLARDVLAFIDTKPPPDNFEVLVALNNLGQILQSSDKLADAKPFMERALEISETKYGKYDLRIATTLNNLAQLYMESGNFEDSSGLMERCVTILLKAQKSGEHNHFLEAGISNYIFIHEKRGMTQDEIRDNLENLGEKSGWDVGSIKKLLEENHKSKNGEDAGENNTKRVTEITCPYCYSKNRIIEDTSQRMWFRCWNCSNAFMY